MIVTRRIVETSMVRLARPPRCSEGVRPKQKKKVPAKLIRESERFREKCSNRYGVWETDKNIPINHGNIHKKPTYSSIQDAPRPALNIKEGKISE
jgi:hypothetical protein